MSVRISFGPFILDLDARQLLRDGGAIHLTPKAFELLSMLVAERPRVLSKDELQKRLWPGTFVLEANLSSLVAEIRQALGDRARAPTFIRTAHGFGYAFCGDATVSDPLQDAVPGRPVCWLEWNRRRIPLTLGQHVIGRDADVDIRLDVSTVSRRHARLIVSADAVMLEDFDSKNGTFRGSVRVVSPVRLEDGDTIRIGSHVLTVRVRAHEMSTDTQAR